MALNFLRDLKKHIVIVFVLTSSVARTQTYRLGDSLQVSFVKLNESGNYFERFIARVAFQNISNRPICIYEHLDAGDAGDRFYNAYVDFERQSGGKYRHVSMFSYKPNSKLETVDSLRHYDMPKIRIAAAECDTLNLDLSKEVDLRSQGNYRIKLSVRVQTIKDTTSYQTDTTGATMPPLDNIQYISSDWMYYTLSKDVTEEDLAVSKVFALPEVKRRNVYIDSFSHHTHGISVIVRKRPKKSGGYYIVQAGYNGPYRYEPYFTFYIYRPLLKINYYDPVQHAVYSLEEWRRRRGRTYN